MAPATRTTILTPGQQMVEQATGRPIEDVLRDLYLDQGMTQKEIADHLGVSRVSVHRWMHDLRIPTRYLRANRPAA